MSDDVVTLHSLAASFARLEETLAAQRAEDKKERQEERATDKKESSEERAADKKESNEKMTAFINEIRGIVNKAEEDKAKAKKEREDAEARMWQGLKDGLYATFLSQFTWTHKGGGFCNDTRMKAE